MTRLDFAGLGKQLSSACLIGPGVRRSSKEFVGVRGTGGKIIQYVFVPGVRRSWSRWTW